MVLSGCMPSASNPARHDIDCARAVLERPDERKSDEAGEPPRANSPHGFGQGSHGYGRDNRLIHPKLPQAVLLVKARLAHN